MAAYKYSGLTIASNAATIASFTTTDTFTFDGTVLAFSASQITSLVETAGDVVLTINGVAITFTGLGIDQIDSTKFIFADGSKLLVGDALPATINDTLSNVLLSGDGDDYIDGQTSTTGIGDTVSYASASSAVTVTLANQTAAQDTIGAGSDRLVDIENLTGSNFNDTLTGSSAANILTGGIGNDTMNGGLGDDTYYVTVGDIVAETATDGGTDVVIANNVDFTLADGSNIETLTLTGTSVMGVGNSSGNTINGSSLANILDGAGGVDTLVGGAGNDTYIIDNTGDTVTETSTTVNGTDLVVSTATTYTLTANVENLRLVTNGAVVNTTIDITGVGNSGNNIITGSRADDLIDGAAGNDTITDLSGGNDILIGGAGVDVLRGGKGNDILTGGTATTPTTTFTVGAADGSNDTLIGGAGDDTYYVTETADTIQEDAGTDAGSDTVIVSAAVGVTYNLGANLEILTLSGSTNFNGSNALNSSKATINGNSGINTLTAGSGGDTLNGNGGADILVGGNGVDNLDGGDGADKLTGGAGTDNFDGGAGNDTYVVDLAAESDFSEVSGGGTDVVFANIANASTTVTVTYTLGTEVDNLVLGAASGTVGTAATSTTLLSAVGNALANNISGNAAANTLNGGTGDDTLNGGAGNDTLIGGIGDDTLLGGDGNDTMTDNATATSSAEATVTDQMTGGTGNDTYNVTSTLTTVTEAAAAGTDTVNANVTYTIGGNIEVLTLNTAAGAINGRNNSSTKATLNGNDAVNILTAGSGGDTLNGNGNNDTLNGGSGADTLNGGGGNDIMIGNAGTDIMVGGDGNDSYVIDTSAETVTESNSANAQIDTVFANITTASAVTVTLSANVENLVLGTADTSTSATAGTVTSSDLLNGTGNDKANSILGNNAANTLVGGNGLDTLTGGAGNDTLVGGVNNATSDGRADIMVGGLGDDSYLVTDSSDVVTEASDSGSDVVSSNVTYTIGANIETLTLTGATSINGGNSSGTAATINGASGINVLTAGTGGDTLNGFAGADTLNGGTGNDTLDGGSGKDSMVITSGGNDIIKFSAITDTGSSSTTADTITGFTGGGSADVINLSAIGTFSLKNVGVAHSNNGPLELIRSSIDGDADGFIDDTLITAFVGADNTADFAIVLIGTDATSLVAGNFA